MAVEMKDVAKLYIALFGRAPEGDGLSYWYKQAVDNNWDMATLANAMYEAALQYEDYSYLKDPQKLVESIYENVLGKTYQDDPTGIDYWVEQLKSGAISPGDIARVIIETAETQYPEDIATKTLENRAELALYVAEKIQKFPGDFTQFKKFIDVVTSDPDSIELAKHMVDSYLQLGVDGLLTVGPDYVKGSKFDDVFYAPLKQTDIGTVANTLESGDVIKGGDGNDVLKADIAATSMISGNGAFANAGTINAFPAIAPTIEGVEKLEFTAQGVHSDALIHSSNIDAGNISGVKEIWDVNSRAHLQIEDVRELPENILFGMKDTDPAVDFRVYFDPEQVSKERTFKSNSTLVIYLDDKTSDQLENVKISGISFYLDGKKYELRTPDDTPLGKTYEEFVQNLQKLIEENPELKDRLTVSYAGNGEIVIVDKEGGEFKEGGWFFVDNVVPPSGALEWDMKVGAPELKEKPVETTLILDNVGRSAQGGNVDIGSMGDGGIQVMNVKVDHSSWVTSISSNSSSPNLCAAGCNTDLGNNGNALETVNLYSLENNGDLYVGNETPSPDHRVIRGFVDVKEVLNKGFNGELKYGVCLTDNSISKYLDKAKDVVTFTYDGSSGDDIITIIDNSTNKALSSDPFFAMEVNLSSGNDRLDLNVPNVNRVKVNGGEGKDAIAVNNSHGTTAQNTFAAFESIEVYEVEASQNTTHKFDKMASVQEVVVDTQLNNNNPVSTTLIHLPAAADVVISGRWQTLQNTNGNQAFSTIDIQAPQVTPNDTKLKVVLENTARVNGVLTVSSLKISDFRTELNKVNALEIVSSGARQTSNVINNLSAHRVNVFKVSGTQNLDLTLTDAALYNATKVTERQSLTFDASEFKGQLTLKMDATLPSGIEQNTKAEVNLKGGASDQDTLVLYGNASMTNKTVVTSFEKVALGGTSADAGTNPGISGSVNISKFLGVKEFDVYKTSGDFTLDGLSGGENVVVNMDQRALNGALTLAASQKTSSVAVTFKDFDAKQDKDVDANLALNVKNFTSLKVNIEDNGAKLNQTLTISDVTDPANNNPVLSKIEVVGGKSAGNAIDALTLNLAGVSNKSLTVLNVQNYDGYVLGATIDTTQGDKNVNVILNKWGGYIKELNSKDETTVVKYTLASDMAKTGVWILDGFETGDGSGKQVGTNDKSIINLAPIGINDADQFKVYEVAVKDGGSWKDGKDLSKLSGITVNGNDIVIDETKLKVDINHDGDIEDTAVSLANEVGMDLANDQGIYLVVPNDATQHSFHLLVGVNDAQVPLNEDFFNGL